MKISGSGRIQGGKLDEDVIVSGSGHISENLECNGIRSSGTLRGAGALISHGEIKSSGSFYVDGYVRGDNDAKFSGLASIGDELVVQGALSASGSFRVGSKVNVSLDIVLSGSSRIAGDLLSEAAITLDGTARIYGDIQAEDVYIDTRYQWKLKRIFSAKKYPYKIHGTIHAKNEVVISRTRVYEDVKGRDVNIGERSDIKGIVYYVDKLEVHKKATLHNKPIKIKDGEL